MKILLRREPSPPLLLPLLYHGNILQTCLVSSIMFASSPLSVVFVCELGLTIRSLMWLIDHFTKCNNLPQFYHNVILGKNNLE